MHCKTFDLSDSSVQSQPRATSDVEGTSLSHLCSISCKVKNICLPFLLICLSEQLSRHGELFPSLPLERTESDGALGETKSPSFRSNKSTTISL